MKVVIASLGLAALACSGAQTPEPSAQASPSCRSPAGVDYSRESTAEVRKRLASELRNRPLQGENERFRAWIARQVDNLLDAGARNLAGQADCGQIEQAAARVAMLAGEVAEVARAECTVEECTGRHFDTPEVVKKLHAKICPLYPFC